MKKTFSWILIRDFELLHAKEAARDHRNPTETRERQVIPMAVPHLGFTPKV